MKLQPFLQILTKYDILHIICGTVTISRRKITINFWVPIGHLKYLCTWMTYSVEYSMSMNKWNSSCWEQTTLVNTGDFISGLHSNINPPSQYVYACSLHWQKFPCLGGWKDKSSYPLSIASTINEKELAIPNPTSCISYLIYDMRDIFFVLVARDWLCDHHLPKSKWMILSITVLWVNKVSMHIGSDVVRNVSNSSWWIYNIHYSHTQVIFPTYLWEYVISGWYGFLLTS